MHQITHLVNDSTVLHHTLRTHQTKIHLFHYCTHCSIQHYFRGYATLRKYSCWFKPVIGNNNKIKKDIQSLKLFGIKQWKRGQVNDSLPYPAASGRDSVMMRLKCLLSAAFRINPVTTLDTPWTSNVQSSWMKLWPSSAILTRALSDMSAKRSPRRNSSSLHEAKSYYRVRGTTVTNAVVVR